MSLTRGSTHVLRPPSNQYKGRPPPPASCARLRRFERPILERIFCSFLLRVQGSFQIFVPQPVSASPGSRPWEREAKKASCQGSRTSTPRPQMGCVCVFFDYGVGRSFSLQMPAGHPSTSRFLNSTERVHAPGSRSRCPAIAEAVSRGMGVLTTPKGTGACDATRNVPTSRQPLNPTRPMVAYRGWTAHDARLDRDGFRCWCIALRSATAAAATATCPITCCTGWSHENVPGGGPAHGSRCRCWGRSWWR